MARFRWMPSFREKAFRFATLAEQLKLIARKV
jgi:hypothetical protein